MKWIEIVVWLCVVVLSLKELLCVKISLKHLLQRRAMRQKHLKDGLLIALLLVTLGIGKSYGQTNTPPATNPAPTGIDAIIAGAESGATNWVFAVDGLYAPHAASGSQFGGIAMLGYAVSPQVIVGVHAEYLNDLPTYGGGQLTLQLPTHPLIGYASKLPAWLANVSATPWGFVGSGVGFGKESTKIVGEAAAGLALGLYKDKTDTFEFGLNAGIGKRTDISGEVYVGGLDFKVNL
jgi:uncharacterized membrane protein